MKEFKGTNTDQGWNLHRDEEGDLYVIAGHEDFFGGYTPVFKCEQHSELGDADAKLAASAPELLEILQELLVSYEGIIYSEFSCEGDQLTREAHRIINKSLGE